MTSSVTSETECSWTSGPWNPRKGSNTYRLERDFGWSGLAVDAIEEFVLNTKSFGKTCSGTAFVGDVNTGSATLHVPVQLTAVASGTERFVHNFTAKSLPRQARRTLDSLLDQAGITRIDLLSMDIELSEPAALRGFEVDRFRPRLVCIEAHGETRQAILDYFAARGYVLVGKYLPHDRVNLYFQATGVSITPRTGDLMRRAGGGSSSRAWLRHSCLCVRGWWPPGHASRTWPGRCGSWTRSGRNV